MLPIKISRILIIKLSSIGDVTLITPCIRTLKLHYPDANIDMIVEEESYDIVKYNPYLDRILIFRRTELEKKILKFFCWQKIFYEIFGLIKQLRKYHYDLAFDFQGLLRSVVFLYLAKAKYKIGKGRWLFLSKNIITNPLNAVEGYLNILKTIGIEATDKKLEIFVSQEDKNFTQKFFFENKIDENDLIVIFNLATRWQSKIWPLQNFIELGQMIINEFFAKIILTGSKKELSISEEFKKQVGEKVYIATGKTNLRELCYLIKKSKIFITSDTGPMHIASATNTKVIALFGPTDPRRTGPIGNNIVITKNLNCSPCFKRKCKNNICMKSITSNEVIKIIRKILNK